VQYLSQGAQQSTRIIKKREVGMLSTGWSYFQQLTKPSGNHGHGELGHRRNIPKVNESLQLAKILTNWLVVWNIFYFSI
jgi:hypothetical protein